MGFSVWEGFPDYIPVAERRRRAEREIKLLAKQGQKPDPVRLDGETIARSFWGRAWCQNLESYSDYTNRLPRGRSYVRSGAVIHLAIAPGRVAAYVTGTALYRVEVDVVALPKAKWKAIQAECAGRIDSLVELLKGRLSDDVMAVVTRRGSGLFPSPAEIDLSCSCPDVASLCKHLAAVLYGVGARLDREPELLFRLRNVDHGELLAAAGTASPLAGGERSDSIEEASRLDDAALSEIFGIELGEAEANAIDDRSRRRRPAMPARPRKIEPKPRAAKRSEVIPRAEARTRQPLPPRPRVAPKARRVTSKELVARGVSRPTIQNWLFEGVLLATEKRGAYRTTPETETRIARYLARRR